MLFYDKRKRLAKLFEEWRKKDNLADSAFNVITFLHGNNLIDEEKTLEFLAETDGNDVRWDKVN